MVDSLLSSVLSAAEPASKSDARAASPQNPKDSRGFSAAAYVREDLAIRLESRDGDVLEVRRSVTVAAAYGRNAAGCGRGAGELNGGGASEGCGSGLETGMAGEAGKAGEARESEGGKGSLSEALKWVREVSRELEKQQMRLIEALLKGTGKDGEGVSGGFVMFNVVLAKAEAEAEPGAEAGAMDEEYGVPEYWNAENTSDRIVAFATSFAGIFGDDPEFAETIVNAVAEGFSQADSILGELPGKAGKLNRDTRDKVFEKLDIWLEAWKSGAYNVEAQPKALEPALSA